MSHKNMDGCGRWRNYTIGFRVSPEENESINRRVRLSGLSKQEYCIRRCMEREIVVMGNPRVYKALKNELGAVLDELKRLANSANVSDELIETITIVAEILNGLKKEPEAMEERH